MMTGVTLNSPDHTKRALAAWVVASCDKVELGSFKSVGLSFEFAPVSHDVSVPLAVGARPDVRAEMAHELAGIVMKRSKSPF